MKPAVAAEFPLAARLTQFNHASYGLSSLRVIDQGERLRRRIESDPTVHLGSELTDRLLAQTTQVARAEGLAEERMALCTNATSGAAAIIDSVPLSAKSTVVVLDVEYSSIRRGWEIACSKAGAAFVVVPVPVPFESTTDLLSALDARAPERVDYLQVSAITSSTAIHLPVAELGDWVVQRGGRLVVDAAHCPGHIPLEPDNWKASAVFGTLHKWYPTLRPVGFLWLTPEFDALIRPAEVSLTWDSANLVERFSWPGTFDPVPRLCVDTAFEQWREWRTEGLLEQCRTLADSAENSLAGVGARCTASREFQPPRLRAFVLDGADPAEVKNSLLGDEVRAWVGQGAQGECLLRLATHIYNDENDVDRVTHRIKEVLSR
ncbi:aminotransferase class V-fold PLP-dependent enzyme [Nocardia sp. NPDC003979]